MIHIRPAGAQDAGPLAVLLNEVIAQGGTTAMVNPIDAAYIRARISESPRAIWILAEDDAGHLKGFQYVSPHKDIGPEVAQIATFARVGQTGLGIGSKLFSTMCEMCRDHGYVWINAEIRADNTGGLIYYQSRGFEDYGRIKDYRLDDGMVVDKVLKRYDL